MGISGTLLWFLVYLLIFAIFIITFKLKQGEKRLRKNGIPYAGGALSRFFKIIVSGLSNDAVMDIYNRSKETGSPVAGFTDFTFSPGICITNLDLIKNVCVKDFEYFVNHRPMAFQKSNFYFSKMLFLIEDEQWKGVRGKVSPALTTAKVCRMFSIFNASGERMTRYIKDQMKNSEAMDLDFLQLFPKYTINAIASCAFGIDGKCFDVPPEERSVFEEMGDGLQFSAKPLFVLKFILYALFPKLMDYLGIELLDPEPIQFFAKVVKDEMKRRRQTGQRFEDILQLMMDAQQGMLRSNEEGVNEVMYGTNENATLQQRMQMAEKASKITFDDDDIAANSMAFMQGGFDPTLTLLLFALYQLALEQEIQEKVYKEVLTKIENVGGGNLTYESIIEMNYLDMFLNETLRIYSPILTERSCSKDYTIPGTNLCIEKGNVVQIPLRGIHYDPKYFRNPDKFEPERFLPERKLEHSGAFMPFGMGPRNCIGMRFALIIVKAAIARLLQSFKIQPCSRTMILMKFTPSATPKPKGSMWLQVSTRATE